MFFYFEVIFFQFLRLITSKCVTRSFIKSSNFLESSVGLNCYQYVLDNVLYMKSSDVLNCCSCVVLTHFRHTIRLCCHIKCLAIATWYHLTKKESLNNKNPPERMSSMAPWYITLRFGFAIYSNITPFLSGTV